MALENKAEIIAALKEKKAKAIELTELRNKYEQENEREKAADAEADLTQVVNEYTGIAKNLGYDECKAAKNPMAAACKKFNYDTIRIKENPVENSTMKLLEIEDTVRPLKLRELHKKCNGIGVDQKWIYAVEKFNQLMTARQCIRRKIEPTDVFNSYYMNKLSKEIKMDADLTSEENVMTVMTQIVQMMIGKKYTPEIEDMYDLIDTYAKKDNKKALKVICSNHEKLTREFQSICHRLLVNGQYEVEYKREK